MKYFWRVALFIPAALIGFFGLGLMVLFNLDMNKAKLLDSFSSWADKKCKLN